MDSAEKPVQGKIVGVIIPPPDIRAIVDKTAQFVGKNGKSFEQRILNSAEGKTAKFNFMKEFDPYHAYYELKIREAEEAIATGKDPATVVKSSSKPSEESKTSSEPAVATKTTTSAAPKKVVASSAKAALINPVARLAQIPPSVAPYPLEFAITHPSGVSAVDIEIIKLTAQYTAVNGREFLATIAQREQRNPQFDFLKPTHMLFSYFTTLVDSYAKIVHPSNEQLQRVYERTQVEKVLEYTVHRWSWKHQEEARKRQETDQANAEKLAFQQVDWSDFAVVEVIDFPEDELLDIPGLTALNLSTSMDTTPPPAAPTSSQAFKVPPPPPPMPNKLALLQPPPPPPSVPSSSRDKDDEDDDIKVVANYQPRIAGHNNSHNNATTVIDPVSGKAVPINQLEEHMRIQLLDPKWKEEQRRYQEKQKETGYAEGASIADNLKVFAKKRGDIFGQAILPSHNHNNNSSNDQENTTNLTTSSSSSAAAIAEEEAQAKRAQEERASLQWDGYVSSISMMQQLSSSIPDQNSQHAMQAYTGIGPGVPPPQTTAFPPPPPPAAPAMFSAPTPMTSAVYPGYGMVPPPPPVMPTMPTPAMHMGFPSMPMPPPPMPTMPMAPTPLAPNYFPTGPSTTVPTATIDDGDESKTKKARIEATLIPAEEFAASFTAPIDIHIQLPQDASMPQWNLNGQMVKLSVPVLLTTKDIKESLSSQHLGNMPIGKFQLKHNIHGFLKDVNSLAALNLGSNTVLELSIKSRGGKR